MATTQLILIRGPIGAGKSSVVSALRKSLKAASAIDFDELKRQIDNTASSDWRREVALDTALYLCERLMKKKRLIIADIHSSHREQLDGFINLARQNGYKATSFLLNPPIATCIERAANRTVPGITYRIDKAMVEEYWHNTVYVAGETVFDDPEIPVSEIADEVIKQIIPANITARVNNEPAR